jgi:hypothetical protein
MTGRSFELRRKQDKAGKITTFFEIECSACHRIGEMAQKSIRNLPREAVQQYFRNHGWNVGNGPRKDLCPTCAQRPERPKLEIVSTMEKEPMTASISIPSKAEPPRVMSREDRRIIYAKIEDVYDVKGGYYKANWTDKLVGSDLGVPWAWVQEIREEFFGPELDAATVKRREEVLALRASLDKLSQQIASINLAMAAMERKLKELEN